MPHLAELVLVVPDVPAAAAFYRDLVGLTPESEPSDTWAWFIISGAGTNRPQRLALTSGPLLFEEHSPHPVGERFGPVHFAIGMTASDADAALARLRAADVAVHGPTRLEWMAATSYYFYDPAGNLAELWVHDDNR